MTKPNNVLFMPECSDVVEHICGSKLHGYIHHSHPDHPFSDGETEHGAGECPICFDWIEGRE